MKINQKVRRAKTVGKQISERPKAKRPPFHYLVIIAVKGADRYTGHVLRTNDHSKVSF